MLIAFRREFRKGLKRKEATLGSMYMNILLFVVKNRRVFKILFKYGGDRVAENMILEAKEQIAQLQHLPKNSDGMFRIYAKEVAGVIEAWGEKDFSENEIERVRKDIIYLTTTMRQRLGPVNR